MSLKFTSNQGEVVLQDSGSVPNFIDVVFHDEAITPSEGDPLQTESYKTLTMEIYGTSISRSVVFYGVSNSGVKRNIKGIRLSDYTISASTTGSGEIWQFDIVGLVSVIMELASVEGGNVSVKGRAVSWVT